MPLVCVYGEQGRAVCNRYGRVACIPRLYMYVQQNAQRYYKQLRTAAGFAKHETDGFVNVTCFFKFNHPDHGR